MDRLILRSPPDEDYLGGGSTIIEVSGLVVQGLSLTQLRGLREFYSVLTGRTKVPEIGGIRSDMEDLMERLNLVAPPGLEPGHP